MAWGMIAFASISALLAGGGIYAIIESRNLTTEDPWDSVVVNEINKKN